MAVSFPLALAQFIYALPIKSISLYPNHNNEMSRTRAGQFITAYNGPTLWQGTVTLGRAYNEDAAAAHALISLAQQYDASFLMCHPNYKGPRRQAAVATGRLAASPSNMRDVTISGLPNGYVLSSGDRLSWPYESDPVRYAFHTVVFNRTVAGGTVTVEVQPMLKPGSLVTNAVVELARPQFRAKIVPGSVKIGDDVAVISEGSSFDFQQVLGD